METPDAQYTRINLAADSRRVGRLNGVMTRVAALHPGRRLAVLDLGCGPGVQFTGHLGAHAFTGLDISPLALQQAAANGYVKTVCADIRKGLPFEGAAFDVIVMSDILEHLESPLELLQEARRCLKPDGHMILSVPNHFFLQNRWRILTGKGLILDFGNHREYEDWNYFHLRFFRHQSMHSLIRQAGLAVVEDLSASFTAPAPRWVRIPVLGWPLRALRRATRGRWVDLWAQHFVCIVAPAGGPGNA